MWLSLDEFLQTAEAERRDDGRWTVYPEPRCDRRIKIGPCKGETAFEAIEDAWRFIQLMNEACRDLGGNGGKRREGH